MERYKKYVEKIPEEVRLAITTLEHEIRQAILILLNQQTELSFSDICKELGIDKVKLNFHLKRLFSSALIDHYYRHELGNPKYSFYSITPIGKRILSNLMKAFIPPLPIRKRLSAKEHTKNYDLDSISSSVGGSFTSLQEKKTRPHIIVCVPLLTHTQNFAFRILSNSQDQYVSRELESEA